MRIIKSKPNSLPFVYWINHRPKSETTSERCKSFSVGDM